MFLAVLRAREQAKKAGASFIARVWLFLFALAATSSALYAGGVLSRPNLVLTPPVLEALRANELGRANEAQKALLFRENDTVNRARLNDWISDNQYQAAQTDFAKRNEAFARNAATEVTGDPEAFRVQAAKPGKPKIYAPGTDSDYIIKLNDPIQVEQMQTRYNQQIDAYLRQNNVLEKPGTRWHNRLDTDFMADPGGVTKEQFEKIATMNNDAYKRQGAAEYERISRANDGTKVGPQFVRPYGEEMIDFAKKKATSLDRLRSNLDLWQDRAFAADIHRLSAQEQKYIERIESATDLVRRQNGLPSIDRTSQNKVRSLYTLETDANGNNVLRRRFYLDADGNPQFIKQGSVAHLGSARTPETALETFRGRVSSENSLYRALREMGQTYAELSRFNADFRTAAPEDVAALTKKLPAGEKGLLLDSIRDISKNGFLKNGLPSEQAEAAANRFAQRFAEEMRKALPPRDPKITDELQRASEEGQRQARTEGVADGSFEELTHRIDNVIAERLKLPEGASPTREQFNEAVTKHLPRVMNLIDRGFTLYEMYEAGQSMTEYAAEITESQNPNISDAEAEVHFRAAEETASNMAVRGTLGASFLKLCEFFPTMCAILGSGSAGYAAGRYVLENTEAGKRFEAAKERMTEAGVEATDRLGARITGRETAEAAARRTAGALLERYMAALQNGLIEFRDGKDIENLFQALDAFERGEYDLARIRNEILRQVDPQAKGAGSGGAPGNPPSRGDGANPPQAGKTGNPPGPPPPPGPLGPGQTEAPPLVSTVPQGSRGPCPDGSWPIPTSAGAAYSTDGPLKGDVTADFSPKPLNCREQSSSEKDLGEQQAALAPEPKSQASEPWLDDLEEQRDRCDTGFEQAIHDILKGEAGKGAKIDTAFIKANSTRLIGEATRRVEQQRRECEGLMIVDGWPALLKRSALCAEEAEAAKKAEDRQAAAIRKNAAPAVVAKARDEIVATKKDLDACLAGATRPPKGLPAAATAASPTPSPPSATPGAPQQAAATAAPTPPSAPGAWAPPADLVMPQGAASNASTTSTTTPPPAREGHVPAANGVPTRSWEPPAGLDLSKVDDGKSAAVDANAHYSPPAPYSPSGHDVAALSDPAEKEKDTETLAGTVRKDALDAKRAENDCRKNLGDRFVRIVKQGNGFDCVSCDPGYVSDGGQCVLGADQATAQCRQQYGTSFLRLERGDTGYNCQFCHPGYVPSGGLCIPTADTAKALCQQQYGARFLRIIAASNGYSCEYCLGNSAVRNGQCISTVVPQQPNAGYGTQRYAPRKQYQAERYVPRKQYQTQTYVPRRQYNAPQYVAPAAGGHQSGGMMIDR